MKTELLSLLSFAVGIAAYSVSQLQQHGKLSLANRGNPFSFWGKDSHVRKYKDYSREKGEAFFLSTTWLVFLTDGYHFCQMLAGLFISLSFVPILGWTYGIAFWILAHVIHFVLYRTLQR